MLNRISVFITARQYWGFIGVQFELLFVGNFQLRTVETGNRSAIMVAAQPGVTSAELALSQFRLLPDRTHSSLQCLQMVDVLLAAGNIWQTLVGTATGQTLFRVRIVAPAIESFTCGNGIPVTPHCSVADNPKASILIRCF